MKHISLNQSIYELTGKYPEMVEIMKSFGFKDIINPIARKTGGKAMTIPKACEMKGIPIDSVLETLIAEGFGILKESNQI